MELREYRYECCDAQNFCRAIDDGSIKLLITSPPYNIGKAYETRVGIEQYLEKMSPLLDEFYRIIADDGSLCWQVGNYVDDGEVFPLDIFYYPLFKRRGFRLRNRIVWHFGHGLHCSKRFSGRYETLLWFTKSDEYTFNLDAVRVPSKYPGKRHFKGSKRGQLSGNPLGKNPSDVWEMTVERLIDDWDCGLWEIPNVKANHIEKVAHPCQYPVELVERCVLALTEPGDIVFDPFAGVASTLIGALKNDRRAYGSELEAEYVAIGRRRIEMLRADRLQTRPIYRQVYEPKPTDKLARRPPEWESASHENDAVVQSLEWD